MYLSKTQTDRWTLLILERFLYPSTKSILSYSILQQVTFSSNSSGRSPSDINKIEIGKIPSSLSRIHAWARSIAPERKALMSSVLWIWLLTPERRQIVSSPIVMTCLHAPIDYLKIFRRSAMYVWTTVRTWVHAQIVYRLIVWLKLLHLSFD